MRPAPSLYGLLFSDFCGYDFPWEWVNYLCHKAYNVEHYNVVPRRLFPLNKCTYFFEHTIVSLMLVSSFLIFLGKLFNLCLPSSHFILPSARNFTKLVGYQTLILIHMHHWTTVQLPVALWGCSYISHLDLRILHRNSRTAKGFTDQLDELKSTSVNWKDALNLIWQG